MRVVYLGTTSDGTPIIEYHPRTALSEMSPTQHQAVNAELEEFCYRHLMDACKGITYPYHIKSLPNNERDGYAMYFEVLMDSEDRKQDLAMYFGAKGILYNLQECKVFDNCGEIKQIEYTYMIYISLVGAYKLMNRISI